jgi:putative redox protein
LLTPEIVPEVPLKAILRHIEGHAFVARSESNHWLPIDTGLASGGSAAANDPMQLLVIACGGCVSIDVVNFLNKSRKTIQFYELHLDASRADTTPRILRSIRFHVEVIGEGISYELIRRAIDLSLTKYCSVSLSLDRTVTFTAECTVNGEKSESWEIPRETDIYAR